MRSGSKPSWSDIKGKLADFDRQGLIGLVQDLYAASKDNQAFLHARFALGDDVLKPYSAANGIPAFFRRGTFASAASASIRHARCAMQLPRRCGQPACRRRPRRAFRVHAGHGSWTG